MTSGTVKVNGLQMPDSLVPAAIREGSNPSKPTCFPVRREPGQTARNTDPDPSPPVAPSRDEPQVKGRPAEILPFPGNPPAPVAGVTELRGDHRRDATKEKTQDKLPGKRHNWGKETDVSMQPIPTEDFISSHSIEDSECRAKAARGTDGLIAAAKRGDVALLDKVIEFADLVVIDSQLLARKMAAADKVEAIAKKGRPFTLSHAQQEEIRRRRLEDREPLTALAKEFGVDQSTISRVAREVPQAKSRGTS